MKHRLPNFRHVALLLSPPLVVGNCDNRERFTGRYHVVGLLKIISIRCQVKPTEKQRITYSRACQSSQTTIVLIAVQEDKTQT